MPVYVIHGVILIFHMDCLYAINTLTNELIKCEMERELHWMGEHIRDVLYDKITNNVYFVSCNKIQMVKLFDLLPMRVCAERIVNHYIREVVDIFVPLSIVDVIVLYV